MYSPMTPISTPSPESMFKKYTDPSTIHDPRVDEVLKRAALGGDPNYPQIYAIMAIQARTAAKAQANTPQGPQGPQPTVAQNVIAKAAPVEQRLTQGMGSLPVDESTFHAAGGGMVSFADRGLVEGETPEDSDAAAAYGNFAQSMSQYQGVDPSILEHGFLDAKRPKLAMDSAKAASAKASSDEAPDASTSGKKPAITMAEYNKLAAEGVENQRKPAAVGKINKEKPAPETKKDIKKGADKGITALKTNVPQAENDIAAETAARYHKMVGEDPDAVDRKARMEALGLSNAEEKRKAPWMALANAGFGMMAGPSQFAMQNIGAGAQQGLASLAEQQKDMAKAQERHAAMQDAIGERDYARRAKGAELGMTTEAASKKATQDESQFARDIASRERVASINATGMQSSIFVREAGIALRGLDSDLKLAHSELMLATTKKERDLTKARIANIMARKNQITGMIDMQPAGAPVGGSLVADKSGMMNYTPAS